jgi:hypothetical protein
MRLVHACILEYLLLQNILSEDQCCLRICSGYGTCRHLGKGKLGVLMDLVRSLLGVIEKSLSPCQLR